MMDRKVIEREAETALTAVEQALKSGVITTEGFSARAFLIGMRYGEQHAVLRLAQHFGGRFRGNAYGYLSRPANVGIVGTNLSHTFSLPLSSLTRIVRS